MIDFEAATRKRIEARYLFHPDRGQRGEWCAVVYEIDGLGRRKALDVGVELTRRAIKDWIRIALRNKPWQDGGMPAPDHYDRNGIARDGLTSLH